MLSTTIYVTLIFVVLFFSFNYYNLKNNRKLDQKRQDKVDQMAREAIKIMNLVVEAQNALDKNIADLSRKTSERNRLVDSQVQDLQKLVNSDMMSARRDELIRAKELKVALERIVTLTTLSRQQPDSGYIMAIESTTTRIKELETILGIRAYSEIV